MWLRSTLPVPCALPLSIMSLRLNLTAYFRLQMSGILYLLAANMAPDGPRSLTGWFCV